VIKVSPVPGKYAFYKAPTFIDSTATLRWKWGICRSLVLVSFYVHLFMF